MIKIITQEQYIFLLTTIKNLKIENARLRAIINAPDIDFPNSTKGGIGDSVTPTNFTEFD